MGRIEEVFAAVASHADAVLRTNGRGRIMARAGQHMGGEDIAIRLDLLIDGAAQLGTTWESGACHLVMLSYATRVVVVAVMHGGGHLAVIGKPDVQPGILLSYVRRAVEPESVGGRNQDE